MQKFILLCLFAFLTVGASRCANDGSPQGVTALFYDAVMEGEYRYAANLCTGAAASICSDPQKLAEMRSEMTGKVLSPVQAVRTKSERVGFRHYLVTYTVDILDAESQPFAKVWVECDERMFNRRPIFGPPDTQIGMPDGFEVLYECRVSGLVRY